MIRDKVSYIELSILSIFLFKVFSNFGMINEMTNGTSVNTILNIITGSLIGLLIIKSYFYIGNYDKEHNIFEKIKTSYFKIISPFLNIMLLLVILIVCIYLVTNTSVFINNTVLNDIDILPISILFVFISTYLASTNIKSLVTAAGILIFLSIVLIVISGICLLPYINSENMYPITTESINVANIFVYTIITVSPIFLLLTVPTKNIFNISKYKKYQKITYIIVMVYILFKAILMISILGMEFMSILKYPEVNILKKVTLLNFVERIEDILLISSLIDSFITLSISIHYLINGIKVVFETKKISNRTIAYIIGIIILFASNYLKINKTMYLVYALGFFTLIHILFTIKIIFIGKRAN